MILVLQLSVMVKFNQVMDKDNNLYAILSDTNAGYDNIMKSVSNLKLQNMLLLDSGGSSQLSVNGKTIVASQDDRAVPDYIVMK